MKQRTNWSIPYRIGWAIDATHAFSLFRDGRDDCDGILDTAIIVATVSFPRFRAVELVKNIPFSVRTAVSGIIAPETQPWYSSVVLISRYGILPP